MGKKHNKLDRSTVETVWKLTPYQEGVLSAYLNDTGRVTYCNQVSFEISGNLNLTIFQRALQITVDENPMLRSVFRWIGLEQPVQIVLLKKQVVLDYIDFSTDSNSIAHVALYIENEIKKGIQLDEEPIRFSLLKKDEACFEFIIIYHHCILDGWSTNVLLKKLWEKYSTNDFTKRKEAYSYKAYGQWLEKRLAQYPGDFWNKQFVGIEQYSHLPQCVSKEEAGYNPKTEVFSIDKLMYKQMLNFCARQGITLAALLYAAWGLVLQRYCDMSYSIFGAAVSIRPVEIEAIDDTIGLFVNTIPILIEWRENEIVSEQLKIISGKIIGYMEHKYLPLHDIKREIGATDRGLFDSVITIENYPVNSENFKRGELRINGYNTFETLNYDLNFVWTLFEEEKLIAHYNNSRIDEDTLRRISRQYQYVLSQILQASNETPGSIEVITPEEKAYIAKLNSTTVTYPDKSLAHILDACAKKYKDNIAVLDGDIHYTYEAFSKKVDALANFLRRKGIQRNQVVGIKAARSFEMLISIHAVIKAGGAYLPIDTQLPKERIEFYLQDTQAKLLITDDCTEYAIDIEQFNIQKINFLAKPEQELAVVSQLDDIAYIIYTSGSTGEPKGVIIEQHSVVNRLIWMQKQYNISNTDTIMQKTPISFDVSVWELFVWCLAGAKCSILPDMAHRDAVLIAKTVESHKVTIMHFVPTMLALFLESMSEINKNSILSSLKQVFVSGEALPFDTAREFKQIFTDTCLHNLYGPTEATVDVTYYPCDGKAPIYIGRPIDNTQIYILDSQYNQQPIGVPGELYIAGVGLARGYLHRPGLTEERFIYPPNMPSVRLYKTGDIARWVPCGQIEYLGRNDHQVKINGIRIELGEIEEIIRSFPPVKNAVVVCKKYSNNRIYLAAYYISGIEINVDILREYIAQHLPRHMLPEYMERVESIPLLSNGKVNHKVLVNKPVKRKQFSVGNKAVTSTEAEILAIYRKVLQYESFGIADNYYEAGGDSLLATRIANQILTNLNKEILPSTILKYPTVEALAKRFFENENIVPEKPQLRISPALENGAILATASQRYFYLMDQANYQSGNIAFVIRIEGLIAYDRISDVLNTLVARHEVLRTSFVYKDNLVMQVVGEQVSVCIKRTAAVDEDSVGAILEKIAMHRLSIDNAPLMYVELVSICENISYLAMAIHHIIADDVSVRILIEEFTQLLQGRELPQIDVGYTQYALLEQSMANIVDEKARPYWTELLSGDLPLLDLPFDYPNGVLKDKRAGQATLELNSYLSDLIFEKAKECSVTPFVYLLSIYYILLWRYTGQTDILIGYPVNKRISADFEQVVGNFVNTLVYRMRTEPDELNFSHLLKLTKEQILCSLENRSYPFDLLVNDLEVSRDNGSNPVFATLFTYQETVYKEINTDKFKLSVIPLFYNKASVDIDFEIYQKEDGLVLRIQYDANLFREETIQRLLQHYKNTIEFGIKNPYATLSEFEILKPAEIELLRSFGTNEYIYDKTVLVPELIERVCREQLQSVAVLCESYILTYGELQRRSDRLCCLLNSEGVKKNNIVPVLLQRSPDILVCVLAIWKAGAAFLPLDPLQPAERIKYILEDTGANVVLVDQVGNSGLYGTGISVINITCLEDEIEEYAVMPPVDLEQENTAYVIYTSGSTGLPKGVAVSHGSLLAMTMGWRDAYQLDQIEIVLLQLVSFSFDVFVGDIARVLPNGGTMVLCPQEQRLEIQYIANMLVKYQISIFEATPALVVPLMEYVYQNALDVLSLRIIIIGSDECKVEDYRKILRRFGHHARVVNSYGLTEATVDSSFYEETMHYASPYVNATLPIGKPMRNVEFYIVNKYGKLQPIGVKGELIVGGLGVSKGYVNKPELTAEKFVLLPHSTRVVYRTGDLAHWLKDGNVLFLGRNDLQIKVHGYRIEMEEIEKRLLNIPQIESAVVVAIAGVGSSKYLVAHLVCSSEIAEDEIKRTLYSYLPVYMVPKYYVFHKKFPLSWNGKIDRKVLEGVAIANKAEEVHLPRNELDEMILGVWKNVLKFETIDIYESFFELGGNSLLILKMFNELQTKITQPLTVADLFTYHTIATLSDSLSLKKQGTKEDNLHSEILHMLTQLEHAEITVEQLERKLNL